MTREELNDLIEQWENAKVDFKREWSYWNNNMPNHIKEIGKNELVKDIIALTNGDIYSTDKTSILPLDKLKQQLLTLLNNYAQPEFLALELELVDEVLVISIPPRGSLISLSKDLKLKNSNTDRKGTTYYRVGEDIRVASPSIIEEFNKKINKHKFNKFIIIAILAVILGLSLWIYYSNPKVVITNNEDFGEFEDFEHSIIKNEAPKRNLDNPLHFKFLDNLPEEKAIVYKYAQKKWDTGVTVKMREGNSELLSFLKDTWLKLSEFYEERHFGNKTSKEYIDNYIQEQYDYHASTYQHQDEPMGTMYLVMADLDVIENLDKRIQDLVMTISMDNDFFDYLNWKKNGIKFLMKINFRG